MTEMKAMELTDDLALRPVTRPVPEPLAGEVLIRVSAVGVTPTEKFWYPTTHKADGTLRSGAIPGHEFAGTVAELGAGVTGYNVGDAVFGLNDWFLEGATAGVLRDVPGEPLSEAIVSLRFRSSRGSDQRVDGMAGAA